MTIYYGDPEADFKHLKNYKNVTMTWDPKELNNVEFSLPGNLKAVEIDEQDEGVTDWHITKSSLKKSYKEYPEKKKTMIPKESNFFESSIILDLD